MKVIILAGGSGTRLYPLSRSKFPKQFLSIKGKQSLFQETFIRSLKLVKDPNNIVIITNKDYEFHVKNQLKSITDGYNIVLEPTGKNTAPAIALAVKYIQEKLNSGKHEPVFVFPSDHIVRPIDKFIEYASKAENIARNDYIITFGINPIKPETGYGYIEVDFNKKIDEAYKVKKFHEKPNLKTAEKYLLSGNFFWNSGMFAFKIDTFLKELKENSHEIYNFFEKRNYKDALEEFHILPDISIDYAIMEKTEKAVVIPFNITWSDVGSWDSVYDVLDKDENNNAKVGNVIDIDTKNSLIYGNDRVIATLGVKDLIIVETDDVLLIAKKGESQKIREVVKILKENKKTKHLTEYHTTVYRPWGKYIDLEKGDRYRIKKIVVMPGESLSLQLHHHRSEHWVVVKGTAKVTLETTKGKVEELFLHENESVYVPKSTKHRLENPGKIPLELIEVQVGEYVEEDDIVRFDDKYNRT